MRHAIQFDGETIAVEETRFQFDLPATMISDGQIYPTTLVNLSYSGLRLRSIASPTIDSTIAISVSGWKRLKACVIWTDGEAIGARFETPLQIETLKAFVRQSGGYDRRDGLVYI